MEELTMHQITPAFRESEPQATIHNGEMIWLTVCEELVEGRWEGFVSIRKREN
jgi:hypothetical protein